MIVFNDVDDISEIAKQKPKTGNQNLNVSEQGLEIELQFANQELQSTYEEIQTSKEELKSTNEELATNKVELQNLNEEVQTVDNIELQNRVNDFMMANNNMKNLLSSIDFTTPFLDKELNIRRFSCKTTKLFKLEETNFGRLLSEIVNELNYPRIANNSYEVLRILMFIETKIITNNQHWFTVCAIPNLRYNDRIDRLVITFIDMTKAKKLENELATAFSIVLKAENAHQILVIVVQEVIFLECRERKITS